MQYLEPCLQLKAYEPEKVRGKLRAALDTLPISIVIIGWDIPNQFIKICAEETHAAGAELYRWQPLLTSDGELPVNEAYRVIGLNGEPVPAHLDMPAFTFMCPNKPAFKRDLKDHLTTICESGMYNGIFLDRMRFPALGNDPGKKLACFCQHCQTAANSIGLDLKRIQGDIKELLVSDGGGYAFVQALLQPGANPNLYTQQTGLNDFLDFREQSITGVVEEAANIARSHGLKVGLDCFSPTLIRSVGQDLRALYRFGDWIKPMTYMHTFAPAGLPFEVDGMMAVMLGGQDDGKEERMAWFARATDLLIPEDRNLLLQIGLPSASLGTEITKAKKQTFKPIYAGIEMVAIDGVTYLNPLQFQEDMRVLKESPADGMVISWDLWHVKEEYLRILENIFLQGN